MRPVRCRRGTFPPSDVHRGQQTGLWRILLSGAYRSWGATTFPARTYRNRSNGGWNRGTRDRGCRGRRRGETTYISNTTCLFSQATWRLLFAIVVKHFNQRIVRNVSSQLSRVSVRFKFSRTIGILSILSQRRKRIDLLGNFTVLERYLRWKWFNLNNTIYELSNILLWNRAETVVHQL